MKFINISQSEKTLSKVDTMALISIYSSSFVYDKFIENFPDDPGFNQKPALSIDMRHNSKKT